MSNVRIRFSSDILRRLGEELNPSVDKGILELVKNSFDADATYCRIDLQNVEKPGGSITVLDNGTGMTASEIENGWLVLGRSSKAIVKRTKLGRVPAGSKGLGRLASLRLGSQALLTTRPQVEKGTELNLLIDWKDYEDAELVDDVDLVLEKTTGNIEIPHGSEVQIENLSHAVSRMDVKRLARELILLADPFSDNPLGFQPELVAPEFDDLARLVQARYFDDAEYHLQAVLDDRGYASAVVSDWKGNPLYSASHNELTIKRNQNTYNCPKIVFDFWIFILNATTFSTRQATIGEVREWLKEFGGVHIYYNDLRVSPYGNPGTDWLDLNLRRVQSPEERPGTNTSIGRVTISDSEEHLVQKTDRSGFIETEEFQELRSFCQDALEWVANRRLEEAEKRRAKERSTASKRSNSAADRIQQEINRAPKDSREKLNNAFKVYEKSRKREVNQLEKEIQLYRTLSTAGITAATFAHESNSNPIKVISQAIAAIERRAKKYSKEIYEQLSEPISSTKGAIDSLAVLGKATLRLLDHEKRRVSRVNLHEVIDNTLNIFKPFLEGRDVLLEKNFSIGKPYIQGSEAALESIITNLLNNALAAFEDAGTKERIIRINTSIEELVWVMQVLDSGPGIIDIENRDIWLPGRTTRRNGTGLGLTIVRDAVSDLNGIVRANNNSDLGGAEIVVELPIMGY